MQFFKGCASVSCNFSFCSSGKLNRSPRKNTSSSKFGVNTNTDYLKIARKGGGHKGNHAKTNPINTIVNVINQFYFLIMLMITDYFTVVVEFLGLQMVARLTVSILLF